MNFHYHIQGKWQLRPLTALAIGSGFGAALGVSALPWWCIVFLIPLLLPLKFRCRVLLAVGFVTVFAAGMRHFRQAERVRNQMAHPFRAEGRFVCTDTRFSLLPDLDMPQQARGELTLPDEGTIPVTATFLNGAERPFYGDVFTVTGVLYPPSPSALTSDRDGRITGSSEPPFGQHYRLRIQHVKRLPCKEGFHRAALQWRDQLLTRLLEHLDNTAIRSQTARLFLGASAGAPAELRNRYVSAGTIHLFAVSGMHVAVLAALLLFLLRPMPFRLRYCAVAVLVWLYVFCTGGAYSAIRAGVMISVWALCRAMLLYAPGWNILCFGWALILAFDPGAVTDLGVQYSFAITAALILGAERFRDLRRNAQRQLQLMTERNAETERLHRRLHRTSRLLAVPFSAVIAFAASSAISLRAQSLFAPGGIAANLLLPLLTPLLFAAMVGKMLLGWIASPVDCFFAKFIALCFGSLDQLCEIVVTLFGRISAIQPALWEIALFYAALFTALGSRRFRPALFGGIIALALLISWPVRAALHPPELWVLSPGCDRPAMVVVIPRGSERALILNAPDFNCGVTASREARKLGVTEAEVWLNAGTNSAGKGLPALRSGGMRLSRLHLPPQRTSRAFHGTIAKSAPESTVCERKNSFAEIAGVTMLERISDDGRIVQITAGDGRKYTVTLPWSFPPVWVKLP